MRVQHLEGPPHGPESGKGKDEKDWGWCCRGLRCLESQRKAMKGGEGNGQLGCSLAAFAECRQRGTGWIEQAGGDEPADRRLTC